MLKAIIENGVVVNIIMADDDFRPVGVKLVKATPAAQIGGRWTGKKFLPPAVDIEAERELMVVTLPQLRIALEEAGLLAMFAGVVSANPRSRVMWEYSATIRRNSPMMRAAIAGGINAAQADDIFRAAAAIET